MRHGGTWALWDALGVQAAVVGGVGFMLLVLALLAWQEKRPAPWMRGVVAAAAVLLALGILSGVAAGYAAIGS